MLRTMRPEDHSALMQLWLDADGVILRESDTPENLARFLSRNPDSSFVALSGDQMVGSIMAGQDGWRGYLYHVAVSPEFRRQGIGAHLVKTAVAVLQQQHIPKIHCLVKRENFDAQGFWEARGFVRRDDVMDYAL